MKRHEMELWEGRLRGWNERRRALLMLQARMVGRASGLIGQTRPLRVYDARTVYHPRFSLFD